VTRAGAFAARDFVLGWFSGLRASTCKVAIASSQISQDVQTLLGCGKLTLQKLDVVTRT
jgi:hypothetical protein